MPRPTRTNVKLLKAVGDRLRKARTAKGLTQEALAEAIGVQPETVSRYERGTIPVSVSQLYEIAKTLDVGVEALLGVGGKRGREGEIFERIRLLDRAGQDVLLALLRRMTP